MHAFEFGYLDVQSAIGCCWSAGEYVACTMNGGDGDDSQNFYILPGGKEY